tara:strand:+ start:1002 stop:1181 length:180 start_codon:yes stop_codon:yes gene_type:complete
MKIQEMLIAHLFNEETKSNIIKALNDKIDVPFINEKTEAKILDAVYTAVEDVMKAQLLK